MSETSRADLRAERLAAQLRANLRRRKAQAGAGSQPGPRADKADLPKDGPDR